MAKINPDAWTGDVIKLLGTVSDGEIARLIGLNPTSVLQKRRTLGIKPFRTCRKKTNNFGMSENDISMLGKKTDLEVSRILCIPEGTVRRRRISLGIKSTKGELMSGDSFVCAACNKEKPREMMHLSKHAKRYSSICKPCGIEREINWMLRGVDEG